MTGLLRHAARAGDARFRLSEDQGATRDALLALPEVTWDEHDGCSGPLTDAAIDVLARRPCEWLEVACAGRPFLLQERSSPSDADREGVGVWIEPRRAARLTASLQRAWRPGAEERAARLAARAPEAAGGGRVSRETRARTLVRWQRHAHPAAAVVIALLASRAVGGTLLTRVLVFAALAAFLLVVIPAWLERWHRRS